MMAIIGFIFLLFVAASLAILSAQMWIGLALFGGDSKPALFPAALSAAVFWIAFHFAPFTVHFTGA